MFGSDTCDVTVDAGCAGGGGAAGAVGAGGAGGAVALACTGGADGAFMGGEMAAGIEAGGLVELGRGVHASSSKPPEAGTVELDRAGGA